MKNLKLRWLFYFVLLGLCLQAQVNNQFKLQLYLADQNGNIYVNRNIGLKISILKSENDFPIYSERQVLTSDATGLLNIPIGAGTNRVGNVALFTQLTAGFIKIEYDPSGGSNYTRMLLQPLVSVPYASISNYALGLKGRGITGNHFADSSILAENLDFNPAKKEDVEILKSWIDTYTNGSIPTLITYSSSPNAFDTAQISAIVSSDGGDSISEKGFVYSLSPNPTINNLRLKAGRGNANFSGVLKGLNASSTYHVRSYAMNRLGIGYGNPITITTASPVSSPTLTTTSASSILTTSAITGGNVTSDGGATITERGVVYAISGIPSLSNSKLVAGTSGTGTYTVNLTGLTGSTKYFFRAYATNSAGTGYGSLDSFVTLTPIAIPTVNTISYNASAFDAVITGNVTADGGAAVTQRGIVFSTSGLPDLNSSKGIAGTGGTGTFSVNLTGLNASTKYYFRGFATNSAGTGYGTLDSLTTNATNCAVTCKDSVFMLTSDKCFDALSFTSVRLNIQNCQTDTLKVVVNDFIPNNGSIIDGSSPIGGWVYTIQNTRNNVLCSGKLHNIDTVSTNTLAASWGYLNEFVNNQGNAVVNLLCNRVSEVLNKNNPVIFRMDSLTALKTTLENKYYVGVPLINLLCNTVEISKTDNLVSSTCDSTFITRKYVIENNLGEDTTLTQIIRFLRPTNSKSKSNDLYNEISLGNFGPMSDGFRDSLVNGLPVKNLTSNNRKYRTGVDTIEISTCDKPINKSDFLPYLKSLYKVVFENKIRSKSTRLYDGYKSNLDTLSLFESLNYSICNYNTDFTFQIQTNNSLKTDYQIVAQVFDWCTSTEIKDTIILSFLNKPIIDIDGNCYDTVHIGSQIWMKENLKVTKYRDGSPINTGLDNSAWSSTQTGAYSVYNNDNLNDKKFGKLYNWYAVNDVRGLCPAGWHVPNDLDWINLKEHLGGDTIAGKALKSVDGWILTSFRGNNQSGFTGLPGGNRNENGIYENSGFGGYFWGSTEAGPNFAWTHGIYASTFLIGRFNNAKSNGRSVRCIEDNSSPIVSTTPASSILATSAVTGGSVTSDGGATVTERGVVYATSGIPSLSNSKVVAGTTGTGTFTVNLTGLTGSTKYFFRAYATNSAGTGFGTLDSLNTPLNSCTSDTIKDIDGNIYNTVSIGRQCWTKENLRVTRYKDGTLILKDTSGGISGDPYPSSGQQWGTLTTGARTIYGHSLDNLATYGYLYNWYAASDSKGLCPLGWHVPTESDWNFLYSNLGGINVAGEKLRTTGTSIWQAPNESATNESGFSALPGGTRSNGFQNINNKAFFINVTEVVVPFFGPSGPSFMTDPVNVWFVNIKNQGEGFPTLGKSLLSKNVGASVRCLKDTIVPISISLVSTTIASSILSSSAITGGSVTSGGGATVTERGVVYATSGIPSLSNSKVVAGTSGTGTFTVNLTGLTGSTKYYFRAYATNSAGTGYGTLDSFVTLTPIAIPTVNTISYNASAFDAVIIGNVTADGGAAVTQRGIVFSTSGLPDLNSSKGIAGSAGTGTFSVNLTGLNASTKYYFRGFATNSAGTGYGVLDSFSTIGYLPVTYAVNLLGASSITTTSAICSGEVIENSVFQFGPPSPPIAERGIVYATSGFPTISNNKVLASNSTGTGIFDANLTELTGSTKYYYRAYAIISSGSPAIYSRLDSFVTLTPVAIPTVNTISYNASAFDAVITGNVTADGGAAVTQRGIVFSTSGLPDLNSSKGIAGTGGTGTFSVNLTGLNASTKYYFRGFATNSAGTGYGTLDSFLTVGFFPPVTYAVNLIGASSITTTSAICSGEVKENSVYQFGPPSPPIAERGIVYATSGFPTISNNKVLASGFAGTGTFDVNLTELTGSTKYYYRAYAIITPGSSAMYSRLDSFVTLTPIGIPTVNTISYNASAFDAVITGNVTADGGAAVTQRGIVFSTSGLPDLNSSKGIAGSAGTGTFSVNLTGLNASTKYYFRGFATNSAGTGYGVLDSFSTIGYLPVTYAVNLIGASSITTTSAICSGEVIENSVFQFGPPSPPIAERGIVYATSGFPTISNNKVLAPNSTGTGIFDANLTELTGSTKYYYRAYAIISSGSPAIYSRLDSFVTLTPVVLPTISTTSLSGITTSSATTGGNVTSDGGATVSERGVVWATSSMPTITLSTKTIDGTGTGNFTSAITGIVPNTIYYVRAYATNSAGTVYGNELTFNAVQGVSCPGFSTVTDIDGNIYNTVQIGTQCWTKENLRVTKYSDGTIIPLDSSGGTSGDNTGHTWGFLTSGLHTLNSHSQSNLATYGYLYNWYAAKGIATSGNTSYKNLCPTGWHVPADGEWNTLTTFLGGQNIAGGKMKSSGTTLWASPNTGATNESGFTGLPGGYRLEDGRFIPGQGSGTGAWWSTSEFSSSGGCRFLEYNNGNLRDNGYPKEFGFSVRCLMDNNNSTSTTSLPTINTNVISNINLSTAVSGGNIMSDGGCTITERGVVWSTSPNPEISLSTKTSDGTGTGIFISNLTNLKANTTYYLRAYATNCVGTGYGDEISFITTRTSMPESCPGLPNITDIDGNIYNTVQIGTQCWTKENLKVTKYNDGTLIPLDSSGGTTGNGDLTWFRRTSGARTIYAHSQSNFSTHGYLYNWYAVKGIDTTGSTSYKNLCPTGWHVPTDEEWDTLTTFLGGRTIAGGKMKSTGTTLWNSPNIDATNGSGFTGLPGGYRDVFGSFKDINSGFFFWSASESGSGPWFRYLHNSNSFVYRIYYQFKNVGASVRCLRDTASVTTAMIPTLTTTPASSILATSAVTGGSVTSDGVASITERGVVYATSGIPSLLNSKVVAGTSGTGTYTVNLTGLTVSTKYYFRAYATNSAGTGYGSLDSMTTLSNYCPTNTITDIDGNVYNTVSIGSQCWTKENLRVTKYRDGTSIPTGLNDATWLNTSTGAYAIYNNDPSNEAIYGKLYNWYAVVDPRALCPSGWHVPSDTEWTTLSDNLGGNIAGGKMKSTGTALWTSPNTGATNQSGFTGLPGGFRNGGGGFYSIGDNAYFWSVTVNLGRALDKNDEFVYISNAPIGQGNSVRCLRDTASVTTAMIPTLTTTPASSILSSSAITGGSVTSDGGATVTERGVVYATSGIPSLLNSKVVAGTSGTGTYTVNMTGLTGSTKYYFRAYATNSAGTGYGTLDSFVTLTPVVLPTISTTSLSGITTSSATTGGNVTSDGGATVSERGVVWATSSMPTITLSTKTIDGTGTGNFTSAITGIVPNTIYYVRAYATNSAGTVYGNELTFNAVQGVPCPGFSTVTDVDGNIYNTVQIGTQCWTKENLRVTKYSDGTIIPLDTSGGSTGNNGSQTWHLLTLGSRTIYGNVNINFNRYGYLYNWYAANKNICPIGWHLPIDAEWTTLSNFLGGEAVAGGKMKSTVTQPTNAGWTFPNQFVDNSSGFTALPGGTRNADGFFLNLFDIAYFWSASDYDIDFSWNRGLLHSANLLYKDRVQKNYGFSIRCLKD